MVKVVITGGSGFIAQHLIKRLQENYLINEIEEITTVDRKPASKKFLSKPLLSKENFEKKNTPISEYPENIPVFHKQCELTNTECLKTILKNKNVVFHLARKRFQLLFQPEKESEVFGAYIRDNIEGKLGLQKGWFIFDSGPTSTFLFVVSL